MTQKLEWLLDRLDESRATFLEEMESLPDEALLTKGAIGPWSIAELLVVLTAWESELVTAMMNLEKGRKPEKLLKAMAGQKAYDQRLVAATKTPNLDVIFDDWQRVRVKLEEWLEVFSERDLTNGKRYKWLKGKSLQEMVLTLSVKRESAYLPQLRAFATHYAETAAQVAASTIILSDDIPINGG